MIEKCIMVLLLVAVSAFAQENRSTETRRETTNPSSVSDSKPNSPTVPTGYATSSHFQRVVVFRFKFDTDLLEELEKIVKQEKIRNAVILSGIGSVRGYHIHQVGNGTFPVKNIFEKKENAPADILNVNGYVINGRVHSHITLSDPDKAFGGHLEPGTRVFTFAVVTVGVLEDSADLSHVDDYAYR